MESLCRISPLKRRQLIHNFEVISRILNSSNMATMSVHVSHVHNSAAMSWDTGLAWGAYMTWVLLCRFTAYLTSTVVLSLMTVAAYRLFFHPLARVPGPRLAAISNVWYAVQVRNGRTAKLGRMLHRQYGPVVRVGPNELWFDSMEACKVIYNPGSGYEKSDFYLATVLSKPAVDGHLRLHFPDALDLLSEFDVNRYRLQRRLIGPVYQTASLVKHEAAIDEVVKQAIARLKSLDGAQVDLKEWMHIIAVECLGAVVLSWSPGLLKKGTDWKSSTHSYQGWRRKSVMGLFPLAVKLEFLSRSFGRAFSILWGLRFKTPQNFRPFFPDVNRKVSKRVTNALKPKPPKDERRDLLADLIQLHQEKPQFTESYLRKMAVTNFGAGHETMASTLTSVVGMIASHAAVHRQVIAEIRQAADDDARSYARSASLAYTQAAIKEAKRLHPVIAMSLARRVPGADATGSPPLRLHGHAVPPGTTVGCNPVALHRNELVCGPRPDAYDPTRWLGDPEAARRMERFSLAWGGGARTCPGRHLAELIVFKTISALFQAFDIEVELPTEEQTPTYFLSMLVGSKARFITARPTGTQTNRFAQGIARLGRSGAPATRGLGVQDYLAIAQHARLAGPVAKTAKKEIGCRWGAVMAAFFPIAAALAESAHLPVTDGL
ncbi:Cytochrome P450 monooxygenase sdnT [Paramyrothecium foliicola]|nr:Cytochrome P450 monooxygenase sdnT [Paramyrothecium foliicola]